MQHFLDDSDFDDCVNFVGAREACNPKLAESQKSTRRAFRVVNVNGERSFLIWRADV